MKTHRKTRRLTMTQALVAFLKNQHVERDGHENPFFAGVWGIFGHGNIAAWGKPCSRIRISVITSAVTSRPRFTSPPHSPRRGTV